MTYCAFIPMRGAGHCPEPTLKLRDDIELYLRLDDGQSADAKALAAALGRQRPVSRCATAGVRGCRGIGRG